MSIKPSDLEVEIYDWPDTFQVEAKNPDRDYYEFYPCPKSRQEVWPHFVDLSAYDTGWCSCRDFRINVEPFLFGHQPCRRECIHIVAARRFLVNHKTKPRPTVCPSALFNASPAITNNQSKTTP